jgi:hypothetical protein
MTARGLIILIALVATGCVLAAIIPTNEKTTIQTPPPQMTPAQTQTPCDCMCGYTQIRVNGFESNGYENEMTIYDRYFTPYRCEFWICNNVVRNGCYEALVFTDREGEKRLVSMERITDCKECITGQCSNDG